MLKAQIAEKALERVVEVGEAITETMHEAAEHARELAEEFMGLQKQMQEMAAIAGKENIAEYTAEQVQKATAANVTPEEWVGAGKAFLDKAGTFVGNQPGAKMTEEESEKLLARSVEYAKTEGVAPEKVSELTGADTRAEEGPDNRRRDDRQTRESVWHFERVRQQPN